MCALLKFIIINIIAAISWLPPLSLQLFSPRLLKVVPFLYILTICAWVLTYILDFAVA